MERNFAVQLVKSGQLLSESERLSQVAAIGRVGSTAFAYKHLHGARVLVVQDPGPEESVVLAVEIR